jgi:hypothetical protein
LTIQAARGFGANLVVLSHLSIFEAKYTRGDVLPACTFYGIAGVDLFFVLSGFIMVAVAGHYTGRSIFYGGGPQGSTDLLADFNPVARAYDRGAHFYQLIDTDVHLHCGDHSY